MEDFFIQWLAALQSWVSVYILYYLIRVKAETKYIFYFILIVLLFVVLKNRLITFEPYTAIDGLAWAMYNIWIYGFIYLLIKKQWKISQHTY